MNDLTINLVPALNSKTPNQTNKLLSIYMKMIGVYYVWLYLNQNVANHAYMD